MIKPTPLTRLRFAHLPDHPPPAAGALSPILSPDDRARVAAFRQGADKWRLILGRALLYHTLSHVYGIERPCITITERGRPRLEGDNPLALDFNIAHAGPWVVCAFAAATAVGVDIADIADFADWPGLVGDYMDASEIVFIRELPPERRMPAAARFWSLKEAALKSAGFGLEIDPRLVRLVLEPRPRLVACPREIAAEPDALQLVSFEHAPGSILAIATLADNWRQQTSEQPETTDIAIVPLDVLLPGACRCYSRQK